MLETWHPWLSAILVAAIIARWSWLTRQAKSGRFTDRIGAALLVLAWHSNVWSRLSQGYPDDTIFNLSLSGRVGLIVLTGALVILLAGLSRYKSRWLQRAVGSSLGSRATMPALDLLLTIVLFVIGLTLIPQLHYMYFTLLLDNLVQQWVIKPISLAKVWHIMLVPREASLALHAEALSGWWLLMLVVLSWLRALRLSRHTWWLAGLAALTNIAWHQFA